MPDALPLRLEAGTQNAAGIAGYVPEQLAAVLDEVFDVSTRAGLHCAPQAHRVAGSLETGALRLSPGYFNTPPEIEYAIESLRSILQRAA